MKRKLPKKIEHILKSKPNTLKGILLDFKINKETDNMDGCYKNARDLSNMFRDLTKARYFVFHLSFKNIKYKKTGCLKEHCLGLQSAAYHFLQIYCEKYNQVKISDIISFLETYAFQISIPAEYKSLIVEGKTINKALDDFQNKHVSIFITFDEYVTTLEKYGLFLEDDDKNILNDLFLKAKY